MEMYRRTERGKKHPVCGAVKGMDLFFITRGWVAILKLEHEAKQQSCDHKSARSSLRAKRSSMEQILYLQLRYTFLLSCLRFIFKLVFWTG